MTLTQDGSRNRYYAERKKVEATRGNPVHEGVNENTRHRIAEEIMARTLYYDGRNRVCDFADAMYDELNRVYQLPFEKRFASHSFVSKVCDCWGFSTDDFLQVLEVAVEHFNRHRKNPTVDINVLQSLLADDGSIFRLVDTGASNQPQYQVQRIDNKHLHTVVTDRTFELTTIAAFASAQNDYADAWKHYSKGDLDDAVTNAGKAVESACKIVVKKVDPNTTPDNLRLGPLVGELVRLNVIPPQMQNISNHLEQIFRGSGSLRNQAGTAHGSLDPTSPEASVALLGLRLSGTLIAFLAERWLQLKP